MRPLAGRAALVCLTLVLCLWPALLQAAETNPPQRFTNSAGMEFALIPAGSFFMGSPQGQGKPAEHPRHQVEITRPFYMQTTEVTRGQWLAVMSKLPKEFRTQERFAGDESLPVEYVSFAEAREFVRRLNQNEDTDKYHLPSEAQWEYACRAGSQGKYCFGDDGALLGEYAWIGRDTLMDTQPVARKKPNAWGLFDMHGNVWEWVADYFRRDYYADSPRKDPAGPAKGIDHALRGGSWYEDPPALRSAERWYGPCYTYFLIGFRVARDL